MGDGTDALCAWATAANCTRCATRAEVCSTLQRSELRFHNGSRDGAACAETKFRRPENGTPIDRAARRTTLRLSNGRGSATPGREAPPTLLTEERERASEGVAALESEAKAWRARACGRVGNPSRAKLRCRFAPATGDGADADCGGAQWRASVRGTVRRVPLTRGGTQTSFSAPTIFSPSRVQR